MRFKAVLLSLILICAFTLNPRRLAVADGGTVSVPAVGAAVVIIFAAATALVFVVDRDSGERLWEWGEQTAGDIWEALEGLPILFVTHGELHGLSYLDASGTVFHIEGETVTPVGEVATIDEFKAMAEALEEGREGAATEEGKEEGAAGDDGDDGVTVDKSPSGKEVTLRTKNGRVVKVECESQRACEEIIPYFEEALRNGRGIFDFI